RPRGGRWRRVALQRYRRRSRRSGLAGARDLRALALHRRAPRGARRHDAGALASVTSNRPPQPPYFFAVVSVYPWASPLEDVRLKAKLRNSPAKRALATEPRHNRYLQIEPEQPQEH